MGLCYATLELDYEYIRAVTPFYSIYEIEARNSNGWNKVLSDKGKAATTIRSYWSPRAGGKYVVSGLSIDPSFLSIHLTYRSMSCKQQLVQRWTEQILLGRLAIGNLVVRLVIFQNQTIKGTKVAHFCRTYYVKCLSSSSGN